MTERQQFRPILGFFCLCVFLDLIKICEKNVTFMCLVISVFSMDYYRFPDNKTPGHCAFSVIICVQCLMVIRGNQIVPASLAVVY